MKKIFSNLMNIGLKIILIPIIGYSICYFFICLFGKRQSEAYSNILSSQYLVIGQICTILVVSLAIYFIFKWVNKQNFDGSLYKKTLFYIIILAFIIRVLWVILIKTVPTSDFEYIWNTAIEPYNLDFSSMHGVEYLARFPHLIITTLYFGFFRVFFGDNALLIVKLFNTVYSTISVIGIGLICKELFNKKLSIYATIIMAIYPTFFMYTSVICSENMAMPFFIFSIYLYILIFNKKISNWYMLLCGLLLSIGNLFRMVGLVVLVAYIIHMLIYSQNIKIKFKNIFGVIVSFLIPLILVSSLLVKTGISENPINSGVEPNITSILKGTNFSSLGGWNEDDAAIPEYYNYDKESVTDVSKEIIIERLASANPVKLGIFYVAKFSTIWGTGDFSAHRWATEKTLSSPIIVANSYLLVGVITFIHLILLLLMYYGLYRGRDRSGDTIQSGIDLIYLIFGGYWILYMITERQSRYGFIVSFVFIIFAMVGLNKTKIGN